MSGGSYNYLCFKDAETVLHASDDLRRMIERLSALDYAQDAAGESEELALIIRQYDVRICARISRLKKIWRAVEWWDSGDSGESTLKMALAEYRSGFRTAWVFAEKCYSVYVPALSPGKDASVGKFQNEADAIAFMEQHVVEEFS